MDPFLYPCWYILGTCPCIVGSEQEDNDEPLHHNKGGQDLDRGHVLGEVVGHTEVNDDVEGCSKDRVNFPAISNVTLKPVQGAPRNNLKKILPVENH